MANNVIEILNYLITANKCAKQTTIAVIENGGRHWIGTNFCRNPQTICPRGNMPSGQGYELCKEICKQSAHAEVNACKAAGKHAKGGTLFLLGHTYCCDTCQRVMHKHGIKRIVIVKDQEEIKEEFSNAPEKQSRKTIHRQKSNK